MQSKHKNGPSLSYHQVKANWLLYVTQVLTFINSVFCLKSAFMWCVWFFQGQAVQNDCSCTAWPWGNCSTVIRNVGKHSLSTVHYIPEDLKPLCKVAGKLSKKFSNHTIHQAQSL